jgi:hypothetical protein
VSVLRHALNEFTIYIKLHVCVKGSDWLLGVSEWRRYFHGDRLDRERRVALSSSEAEFVAASQAEFVSSYTSLGRRLCALVND